MNKINFEVIFVGNVKPDFKLPDNFKFIYSNVKPTQCEFIGALYSSGELLLQVPDDMHYSPFCLDIMYEAYKKENNYKCMVAPMRWGLTDSEEKMRGIYDTLPNQEGYNESMVKNVQSFVGGAISKKFYTELGGPDKRFVFGHSLADLLLRAVYAGGKIIFCPNTYTIERKDWCPGWRHTKSWDYVGEATKLLMYEWGKGNILQEQRTDALQPFEINDTLLTVSQGPRGEWD